MRLAPECVPCLLNRVLYESRLVFGRDVREVDSTVGDVVRACAKRLYDLYNPEEPAVSTDVATEVHRLAYRMLKTDDPYAGLKEKSNRSAIDMLGQAKRYVFGEGKKGGVDVFERAALASVAGNVLDFGIRGALGDPGEFGNLFHGIVDEGFYINDVRRALELLTGDKSGGKDGGNGVVYLTDNCGEIVFDSIVWGVLRDMGFGVYVVVKGRPILTDATMEDVKNLGLSDMADGFYTTGTGSVGIDLSRLPSDTEDVLYSAGLIISKGMANFESLSENEVLRRLPPVLFLLRTKCWPIARHIGAPVGVNVAKLYIGYSDFPVQQKVDSCQSI